MSHYLNENICRFTNNFGGKYLKHYGRELFSAIVRLINSDQIVSGVQVCVVGQGDRENYSMVWEVTSCSCKGTRTRVRTEAYPYREKSSICNICIDTKLLMAPKITMLSFN